MSLGLAFAFACLTGFLSAARAYESSIAPVQATGCQGEVAAFRRIVESDAATGNLGRSVHGRIKPEIDHAAAACAAGREAEAVRMLSATKRRFGYR